MKTIQVMLYDRVVRSLDEVVKELRTTRSAYIRDAIRDALKRRNAAKAERLRHKASGRFSTGGHGGGDWGGR